MKKSTHFNDMLTRAIGSMMKDDAVGEVLGFYRDDGELKIIEVDPEEITADSVHRYEMLLFDGGNEQGEGWKHVFFPITGQEIFSLESEPPAPEVAHNDAQNDLREPLLSLVEHKASNYSPRTYHNAKSADLTVALACDFTTAGEKLTHKAAGANYLGIPLTFSPEETARMILYHLRERGIERPTLNIAGNGIYTLSKRYNWSQEAVNLHLVQVLALVHRERPISKIISGGQTGVDISGIVAAHLLRIDAEATFPNGFIQRFEDGQDTCRSEAEIRGEVLDMAESIRNDLAVLLEGKPQDKPATPAAPASEPPQDEFNFGF